MEKSIESLIRESQRPVRAFEVVVRLANGEQWTFTDKSDVRTPEGKPIPLTELPATLRSRSIPFVTFRGRWRVEESEMDAWKQDVTGPIGGPCEVDFFTDQIVRISQLYRD